MKKEDYKSNNLMSSTDSFMLMQSSATHFKYIQIALTNKYFKNSPIQGLMWYVIKYSGNAWKKYKTKLSIPSSNSKPKQHKYKTRPGVQQC